MTINRKEMKADARQTFKKTYWNNVAASLLLSLATTITLGYSAIKTLITHVQASGNAANYHMSYFNSWTGIGIGALIALALLVLKVMVTRLMEVGCRGYFLKNREEGSGLRDCFTVFKENVPNTFITMLLRDIKLFLWSLLLLVPGIVKDYEYKMVPYILAENPDMPYDEVFALSRKMMTGHKMDAFRLDLSFLGWFLLGFLTFGVSAIFYSDPYYNAAIAEFYAKVKNA